MIATHLNGKPQAALSARTTLGLSDHDLLALTVQAGDQLRGERGTVWITIDGQAQDILLEPGEMLQVSQAGQLNVSALHSGCVSVLAARPLAWQRVRPARVSWQARRTQAANWLGRLSNLAGAH